MKNRTIFGYVMQVYDDHGKPSSQSFVAGGSGVSHEYKESWEDPDADGNGKIEQPDNVTKLMQFNMEQPGDAEKLAEMKETILGYEAEEYDRQIGEQRNG